MSVRLRCWRDATCRVGLTDAVARDPPRHRTRRTGGPARRHARRPETAVPAWLARQCGEFPAAGAAPGRVRPGGVGPAGPRRLGTPRAGLRLRLRRLAARRARRDG